MGSPLAEPLIASPSASEDQPLSNGAILIVLSLADFERERVLFEKYQDQQRRLLREELVRESSSPSTARAFLCIPSCMTF